MKNTSLAFIRLNVTTKAGATVNVSLEGKNYSAVATGGSATIYLPSKGNWTVTCSSGSLTNSQVVAITAYSTYSVNVPLYSATFADNSWADIQTATQAGLAASYWEVGDSKAVTLNGGVGSLTFSNETYYAFILGFDHNSLYEGTNTLHMAFGKTADGKDIAFCDSQYGATGIPGAMDGFRINASATNSGGWSSSYMRNTICTQFLNVLPSDLRNVIMACTKYSDNTGGSSAASKNVTST